MAKGWTTVTGDFFVLKMTKHGQQMCTQQGWMNDWTAICPPSHWSSMNMFFLHYIDPLLWRKHLPTHLLSSQAALDSQLVCLFVCLKKSIMSILKCYKMSSDFQKGWWNRSIFCSGQIWDSKQYVAEVRQGKDCGVTVGRGSEPCQTPMGREVKGLWGIYKEGAGWAEK